MQPLPGTAIEEDVIREYSKDKRLFELMDGVLVEKSRVQEIGFGYSSGESEELQDEEICSSTPALVVETLNQDNSPGEVERMVNDDFESGVKLIWIVDTRSNSVQAHSSPTVCKMLDSSEVLGGGDVLPAFRLPLQELFKPIRRKINP